MNSKIEALLPFCLYNLDERCFKIDDKYNTKIKFTKFKKEPSIRTSESHNIEFLNDRWGIDACSQVIIDTNRQFADNKKAKLKMLYIVNNIIKIYRYFDEESAHLTTLTEADIFNFNLIQGKQGIIEIGCGGGMRPIDYKRIKKISDEIEKALNDNFKPPFYKMLLLNAEYYIFIGDYRMSILESVIALELVLSDFIRKEGQKREIEDKDIEDYIKNIGITGNIKVTIKMLIENDLPCDDIFEECKSGITIRNAIVHKGRENVNSSEAKDTLKSNKFMIKFLINKIKCH